MMNCREATRLMSEAQDQPIGPFRRVSLTMHLMMCRGCRNYSQHMNDLRSLTRMYAKGGDESEKPEDQEKDKNG